MRKVILLILLNLAFTKMYAFNIDVNGFIFYEEDKKIITVPFATVKYFNDKEHKDIAYTRFTDLAGRYFLGDKVEAKTYYVTVEAPGFQKRELVVRNLDEMESGKTYYVHIKVNKGSESDLVTSKHIGGKSLRKSGTTISDILSNLGYNLVDGRLNSEKAKNIKLLFNGLGNIDGEQVVEIFELKPKYLISIEEYGISYPASPYDLVLNIVVPGDRAEISTRLNWTPKEDFCYDE